MKQGIKESVNQIKPWRRDAAWWVLLTEGVVAVVLGAAIMLWPDAAQGWVLLFLAILLALHGFLLLFGLLRGRRRGNLPLVRGALGLLVGMAVIVMPIFGFGDRTAAAWLLAIGLLASGVLAIVAPFFEGRVSSRRGDLLLALFLLLLGGLLLFNVVAGVDVMQLVAWTLLGFGAVLAGFGIYMWRRPRETAPE